MADRGPQDGSDGITVGVIVVAEHAGGGDHKLGVYEGVVVVVLGNGRIVGHRVHLYGDIGSTGLVAAILAVEGRLKIAGVGVAHRH